MADATWPSTLQQNLNQSGFTNTLPDNVIRSSMDVGPDKVRRRDVSAVEPIVGSIVATLDEYNDLVTFYNDITVSGSLPFDWVHPITGESEEFRFTAPPSITAISGTHYTITLNMEIQP